MTRGPLPSAVVSLFEDRLTGLAIQQNTGLIQDRFVSVNGHAGPDRQRQRIAGPGINLHLFTINIQNNPGEKGIVLEVIDNDRIDQPPPGYR